MTDRYLAITFRAAALIIGGVLVVMMIDNFVVYLQTGKWESMSLLRAGYDAHLLKARWFLNVDWGWRVHEWLAQVPLLVVLGALVPVCWCLGLFFARR